MKTSRIEQYVNLLLFIYGNPSCELATLKKELGMAYSTLHNLLEKWIEEKKIKKVRKDKIYLGGTKDEYSITQEGIDFLFRLKEVLNKKLKSKI
jgi:predicted transcriptional regulator